MKQLLVVLLVILALALVACSAGGGDVDDPQEVVITATDIAFDTARIEVVANRPVALTLHNEGALEHDFSIMHIPMDIAHTPEEDDGGHDMSAMEEMPELHMAVMPGASNAMTFTPTEPGEYSYFCTVPGHKDAGMGGTLVVTAP